LRKAQEQYDAGSYEEAAQACGRILKRGDIPEVLMLLAHCYMKLERKPDAVKACLRFADAQAAEDPTKALDALTELIKELPDAALILRRSQLLTKIRQVERV
jgi:lipopolysaccharide biosynthesis regulator YciM